MGCLDGLFLGFHGLVHQLNHNWSSNKLISVSYAIGTLCMIRYSKWANTTEHKWSARPGMHGIIIELGQHRITSFFSTYFLLIITSRFFFSKFFLSYLEQNNFCRAHSSLLFDKICQAHWVLDWARFYQSKLGLGYHARSRITTFSWMILSST